MSLDVAWPGVLDAEVLLTACARDLKTVMDGTSVTLATASLTIRLASHQEPRILSITATPTLGALDGLVSAYATAAFRASVDSLDPGLRMSGSLLGALINDIPVLTKVSVYSLLRAGSPPPVPPHAAGSRHDLCAGWVAGGQLDLALRQTGSFPVRFGPPARAPRRPDDPVGWHEEAELPAGAFRRRRRVDVASSPDAFDLDVFFRDSFAEPAGAESALHEYTVRGEVSRCDNTLRSLVGLPIALPGAQCVHAAGSAGWLVGRPLEEVRRVVAADFVGTLTCTHLNDTLRSLGDVAGLVALLDSDGDRNTMSHGISIGTP